MLLFGFKYSECVTHILRVVYSEPLGSREVSPIYPITLKKWKFCCKFRRRTDGNSAEREC